MGLPSVSALQDPGPELRSEGALWWVCSAIQTVAGRWRRGPWSVHPASCGLAEMKRRRGDLGSGGLCFQRWRGAAEWWCSARSAWMKGRLQQLKVGMWGQCCINSKQHRGFFKGNEPCTQQPEVTLTPPRSWLPITDITSAVQGGFVVTCHWSCR